MKVKKKLSGIIAVAVVMCSVGITIKDVVAANTSITTWAISARVGESKFASTGRKKDNSTPVYVSYTSVGSDIYVGIYGSSSYGGDYINLTYPDGELSWKTMSSNTSIKISSLVYETFGSQAYAKIKVGVTGSAGTYMGSWSPDSN